MLNVISVVKLIGCRQFHFQSLPVIVQFQAKMWGVAFSFLSSQASHFHCVLLSL